jgi:hypothetical protein
MSTNPWPAQLQQYVDADTFQLVPGETTIRTDMDTGPAKVRRTSTKRVDAITATIEVNLGEWNILDNFYTIDCNGGATAFQLAHPLTQVVGNFRFVAAPQTKSLGGIVLQVTMALELLPA